MNALLLKHAGGLKNYGTLKNFTHKCVYKNQSCGDKVVLYLKVNKQLIKKISYKTEYYLIWQDACSIFSDCVMNKKVIGTINFAKIFITSIFKKKYILTGKCKKFNFLLKKNYFARKDCILVHINALIKLR